MYRECHQHSDMDCGVGLRLCGHPEEASDPGGPPKRIVQVLSVTLLEQVPISQAFDDVESQKQSPGIHNQLPLWDL